MRWVKWFCLAAGLALLAVAVYSGSPVSVQTGTDTGVDLPIIMYHSILKDPDLTGTYVLPPDQLECDLKYIRQAGYTPVLLKDVISYVKDADADLPEKPILLTFDDGYYNNYLYVYPLMKQYGMKCVLSIVGKHTADLRPGEHQSPNYSHCSWDQLREMSESGLVEVQNHSYDMHTISSERAGARKCSGETAEHYRKVLKEDVGYLQELIAQKVGVCPTTFTYPYGKYSEESEVILKEMGFEATLSVAPGINHLTKGGSLSLLKRNNREPGLSSAEFFECLLKG